MGKRSKLFIAIFLCLLFRIIDSVDLPKEPNLPLDPSDTKSQENINERGEKKSSELKIDLILCDGRRVTGDIKRPTDEIFAYHTINDVSFKKKISIEELKSITVLSWNLSPGKKKKDGQTFTVSPGKLRIVLRSGKNFSVQKLQGLPLKEIDITNQEGSAKLYFFWNDFLFENNKWHSKLGHPTGQEREDCHKDVIRTIEFL